MQFILCCMPLNFKDMRLKEFEIDTHKKVQDAAYYINGTFEIYFEGFTLIKENCTIEQGKEVCNKLGIKWVWGDDE